MITWFYGNNNILVLPLFDWVLSEQKKVRCLVERSMKARSLISKIGMVFDSQWANLLIHKAFNLADTLGWDIKVWTKKFVLKICENCPKTGYQLWYKLDKANNAYFYFSWKKLSKMKKSMKYCYIFVATDRIFDMSLPVGDKFFPVRW